MRRRVPRPRPSEDERIAALITEREAEIARIKAETERLAALEEDLHALKHARKLLSGEDPMGRLENAVEALLRIPRGPGMGKLAVSYLKGKGKVHGKQILAALQQQGHDVEMPSLVTALHREAKAGKLHAHGGNTWEAT
jgi:hypothetical protein